MLQRRIASTVMVVLQSWEKLDAVLARLTTVNRTSVWRPANHKTGTRLVIKLFRSYNGLLFFEVKYITHAESALGIHLQY